MPLDLFAGNRVSDYETAKAWYERLLGADERVTYSGKARKAIYRDPDGNEIGFAGAVE